jgi:hypothetical protein
LHWGARHTEGSREAQDSALREPSHGLCWAHRAASGGS